MRFPWRLAPDPARNEPEVELERPTVVYPFIPGDGEQLLARANALREATGNRLTGCNADFSAIEYSVDALQIHWVVQEV